MTLTAAAAVLAGGGDGEGGRDPRPTWLDRLNGDDRGCIERAIGYAPPALTNDLQWLNSDPLTWKDLAGKVVVIQSWTCGTAGGRNWALQAARIQARHDTEDVRLIALHIPTGADNAASFLERRSLTVPVVVDSRGTICDALGIFERPVNVVIDRNGIVRYAGLNQRGLTQAVDRLVEEPHDPNAAPAVRRLGDAAPPEFPAVKGNVGRANDIRGRRAPDMYVSEWITERPEADGKVVVLDFWATWCPPCRRTLPHMNKLAETFCEDVVCIGLSNETPEAFFEGLARYKIDPQSFAYHLALDPGRKMQNTLRVRAIPHVIVMSSDWVVRWQGNPSLLKASTLAEIVEANRALTGNDDQLVCNRWTAR
jgi:thiol-disulfide isomerase/thioredoxin